MTEQLANLAQTTLAAPIGAPEAGTSEVIQVTSATLFPTEPVFRLNLGGGELGKVTAVSGVEWTVERGAEGTTPVAHPAGQQIIGVLTKAALEAFKISEAQLPSSVVSSSRMVVNVETYGAKCNANTVEDGEIEAGTHELHSVTAAFVAGDAGKIVTVPGAGAAGGPLNTTIESVAGGIAKLTVAATTKVTKARVVYGADDSVPVKEAEEVLGGKPGVLYTPRPVICGKITLYTGQYLASAGYGTGGWILKGGTNDNLVESHEFASLTGSTTGEGIRNFGWHDCFLDGNKGGQSGHEAGPAKSAHVVATYGAAPDCRSFRIRQGYEAGWWSEWKEKGTMAVLDDSMEGIVTDYKIHDCNGVVEREVQGGKKTSGAGLVHLGPHDSQWDNGIVCHNGKGAGSGTIQIDLPLAENSNGTKFDMVHVYGNASSDHNVRIAGSACVWGDTCASEGGAISQLWVMNSGNRIGGEFFYEGANTSKGVILGAVGTEVSATSGRIKVRNCGGGMVDITHQGDSNHLDIYGEYTTVAPPEPALIGGPPAPNSYFNLHITETGSKVQASSTGLWVPGELKGASRKTPMPTRLQASWLPTGYLKENIPRLDANSWSETSALVSGTLFVFAGPYFYEGDQVSKNLWVEAGATAGAGLEHSFYCLIEQGTLTILAKSEDVTTAAWTAHTSREWKLAAKYTFTKDTQTYIGLLVIGTTPPTLFGPKMTESAVHAAPYLAAVSTTGLNATTFGELATAGALTASGEVVPYTKTA